MDKLEKIINKYSEILTNHQTKYNFNETIVNNFIEFNQLFTNIIRKELTGNSVTIDKRDEFDILNGILTQISGEYNKLEANKLEEKINILFLHRDRVIRTLLEHNFKLPKKKTPKDLFKIKPNYGYHR